jgi:hypothetical protein
MDPAVARHPFQAIRVDIEAQRAPAIAFTIKIKNVGTETVALPDVEMLGHESKELRDHGIGVRVAPNPPERPGYTAPPLVWSRVDPAGPRATGKPIVLPPGGELVIPTAVWNGKGPAAPLLAQAYFSFYSGPAIVEGHFMIRGRALSTGLDLAR